MSRGAAYLLDSHVLQWWWFDPDRLSTAVRELLTNPAIPVLVSSASVWELSLKHQQGKLPELSGAIDNLPGLLQADGSGEAPSARTAQAVQTQVTHRGDGLEVGVEAHQFGGVMRGHSGNQQIKAEPGRP